MAHMTFDVRPGQCFVHKICMLEIGSKDAAVGKWRLFDQSIFLVLMEEILEQYVVDLNMCNFLYISSV